MKQTIKSSLIWGFLLWLFGYILGFVFFAFVPNYLIGWVIMPFGIVSTLWVLNSKIKFTNFSQYVYLSTVWVLIAIIFDYFFIVKMLNPADGYYKIDVYFYYLITFLLPLCHYLVKKFTK